jgi:phenylalanine ammonia-lyase
MVAEKQEMTVKWHYYVINDKRRGPMAITLSGEGLTIADIQAVALGAEVRITNDPAVLQRVAASRKVIQDGVARGADLRRDHFIWRNADVYVGPEQLADVQKLALWQHKSTTGPRLPVTDVRAAMLLRANSLIKGHPAFVWRSSSATSLS